MDAQIGVDVPVQSADAAIPCIRCASPVAVSRRRCQSCGFSADELRRWRLRNLEGQRMVSARLLRRVWEVWGFVLWRIGWFVGMIVVAFVLPFATYIRISPPLVGFQARFSTILALIIAARLDLTVRQLPGWNAPMDHGEGRFGRLYGRWLPGALALMALEPSVEPIYARWIRSEWMLVSIQLALVIVAVAAAASLAVVAVRMDRWQAEVDGATSWTLSGFKHSTAWRFGHVWGWWLVLTAAFIVLDGLLLYKRQANPYRHVEMGRVMVWPILAAQIVWLWNLLAVQRSLRRWVHD